jgi:hypothetical protein
MDSYGPFIRTGLTMNYIATLKAPHNEKKNYIATLKAPHNEKMYKAALTMNSVTALMTSHNTEGRAAQ